MKIVIPEFPQLPARIKRLGELSYNLWWSWHPEARALFRRLDRSLWRRTQHNPVKMLHHISPLILGLRAEDPEFLSLFDATIARFDSYMNPRETWFSRTCRDMTDTQVAYFCAEFAVHNSIPIYSGGLGLLAGDTCKEVSDLGIPFVGIGSYYPEGYFHQRIKADGWQEAHYQYLNTETAPLLPVLNDDDSRLLVSVPLGSRRIRLAVWKVQVGRVPIYLMDTDITENDPWDRDLSMRLYIGDPYLRLRQEIVLGIGGLRVLRGLGYDPSVVHLNEGHAAFAGLELLREKMAEGMGFKEAVESVRRQMVFTTHTPVKAGHDEFSFHMMEELFSGYWEQLKLSREQFLALGQASPDSQSFSMTLLALRLSESANAVSRRHGQVSREIWHFLWPEKKPEEVPIIHITNGVHTPTWADPNMVALFQRYLGEDWWERHDDPNLWDRIFDVPDEEFWSAHMWLKRRLLEFMAERCRRRWVEAGATPGEIVALGALLDPDALTIGFARRFATYKRAGLILHDRERLKRILHNPWRPVQVVFAGKAHPDDEPGKYLVQQVFQSCSAPEFGGRLAFIEEYDKHVAHHLVTGVDVWLNNPRPPQEASGTSGQKASLNGVPNCSVLDGWWYEGFNGHNGWAIQDGAGGDDGETANSLYEVIEQEIVPVFFDRDRNGVPGNWVRIMKEAIRSTAAAFSARRMMKEYLQRMYLTRSPAYSPLGREASR